MQKSLLEMAFEIVSGQSAQRILSGAEIQALFRDTFTALKELERLDSLVGIPEGASIGVQASAPDTTSGTSVAPNIDPSESIKETVIVCMECGKEFRQLTHTHLRREHCLSPDEYRRKYGIPHQQPLAAKSVTNRRKSHAKAEGIGEKLKAAREAARSSKQIMPTDKAKGVTE